MTQVLRELVGRAQAIIRGMCGRRCQRRDEALVLMLGEREYRVRGLGKNLAFDVLRVNLRVRVGDAYHIDTLDLYQAKARTVFINAAAEATQPNPDPSVKQAYEEAFQRHQQLGAALFGRA